MPRYYTTHDLARVLNQSVATARRVLREVWPDRDAPNSWVLGEGEWRRVLRHVAQNRERRFGRRRKRVEKNAVMTDSATPGSAEPILKAVPDETTDDEPDSGAGSATSCHA